MLSDLQIIEQALGKARAQVSRYEAILSGAIANERFNHPRIIARMRSELTYWRKVEASLYDKLKKQQNEATGF